MEGMGGFEDLGSGNIGNIGDGRIDGGLTRSLTSLTTLCNRARVERRSSCLRKASLQVTQ